MSETHHQPSLWRHLLAGLILLSGNAAPALDRTWDGGDPDTSNWSAATNWDGDSTAVTNGDNLIFAGSARRINTNDLLTSIGSVTFNSADWELAGLPVTLGGNLTHATAIGTVRWKLDTTLAATRAFIVTDSRVVELSGLLSGGGGVSGGGAGYGYDDGVLRLSGESNTYDGATSVGSSVLEVTRLQNGGQPSSVGDGTSDLGVGSATTGAAGSFRYIGTSSSSTDRKINFYSWASGGTIANNSPNHCDLTFSSPGNWYLGWRDADQVLRLQGSSTGTTTIAGILSDSDYTAGKKCSVAVSASGTWVLSGTNTYTGPTSVNSGRLLVNGNLTSNSAVTVYAGGTLGGTGLVPGPVTNLASGSIAPGSVGIGTLTVGSLVLSSGSLLRFDFDNADPQTNDHLIVTNPLTLSGASLYLYQAGTAAPFTATGTYSLIQSPGPLGGVGIGALSVANPQAGRAYTFGRSGDWVTLTIAREASWTGGDAAGSAWTLPDNWGGAAPLAGDGLSFGSVGAARRTNSNDFAAGTLFASIVFTNGDAYALNGQAVNLLGSVINYSPTNQILNLPLVLDGGSRIFNAGPGSLVVSGAVSQANGRFGLIKSGAGTLTLAGNASSFAGPLVIQAGTLAFTSVTNVGSGPSALGSPAASDEGAITLQGGATLSYAGAGGMVSDRAIALSGAGGSTYTLRHNGSGVMNWTGAIGGADGTGSATLGVAGGGWVYLSGPISDAGSQSLSVSMYNDQCSLRLAGSNNTFSGAVIIGENRTLQVACLANVGQPSSLGVGSSPITFAYRAGYNGATFEYIGAGNASTDRALSLGSGYYGGSRFIANNSPSNASLSFVNTGPLSWSTAYTGVMALYLQGSSTATNAFAESLVDQNTANNQILSLTVAGNGTWVLSNTNSPYTGGTAVNGGTLFVAGALTSPSNTVSVNAGGTLGGIGSLAGRVIVAAGGTLAGGDAGGSGALTLGSGLTLAAGATYRLRLGGDQPLQCGTIRVTGGGVTLGGATLTIEGEVAAPVSPAALWIILKDSPGAVDGTFAGLPEGAAVFGTGSGTYRISYQAGDGNDVALLPPGGTLLLVK